jgi:hypothetical protein
MHLVLSRLAAQEAKMAALENQRARGSRRRSRLTRVGCGPAFLVAILAALVPLSLLAANPFTDLNPGSVHNDNIEAIYNAGLTKGCDPDREYCPNDNVTREQMASFLARLGGLGSNPPVANARTAQSADTATSAASAQRAENAAQLGGQPASAYVQANSSPTFADLAVTGTINQAYMPGTSNRATPLAFAYVTSDVTVSAGTPNLTVTYSTTNKRYEIEIAGEYYHFRTHPTSVTPNSFNRTLVCGSDNGKLVIYVNDTISGNPALSALQILIFKP